MKKILILFLVLLSIQSFAKTKDPCEPVKVCCEEPPAGPFAFAYPKDVGLSCPRDFYMHGEYLYMQVSQEGMEYVMEQDYATSYYFPLQNGKMKGFSSDSKSWDWNSGFRIGCGFYACRDSWNLELDWTYLRISKDDAECDNGGSGTLLPLFLPPFPTTIRHASARWTGHYNTFDLMFGKPYHVSRWFTSNPMFGLRADWIDQEYHFRYFISEIKENVWHHNDHWGVGLRGSYEADFLLGSGWVIYGKTALAVLYGKFDLSQYADINYYNPYLQYKLEDHFYTITPNIELSIGASWSTFLCKNQYKMALKAGYEFNHWFDINQIRKFYHADPVANDTVSRGDLTFNGFMFGLHFDF